MPAKTIVTGLGRCGSSLMMQILDAGGFPVNGPYPAYEVSLAHNDDLSLAPEGKASKILDIHLSKVPPGEYRWIFLTRDHEQQAKSMIKFLGAISGIELPQEAIPELMKSFVEDESRCKNIIKESGGDVLELSFEDLILRSDPILEVISVFMGGIDIRASRAVIRQRGTKCLPGLLELELFSNNTK